MQNCQDAIADVIASFRKTINGEHDKQDPFKPLFVRSPFGMAQVASAKVYDGDNQPKDDINMYEVLIDSITLAYDEERVPKSVCRSGKTLAKKLLRSMLPIGKWRQYKLKQGTDFTVISGDEAQYTFAAMKFNKKLSG